MTLSRRVLVLIRGALGDTLMTLPFLAALPGRFGAEVISLVGNPAPLRLLANQPFIAVVRDQDRAEWAGLYADPPEVPTRLKHFIRNHQAGVVLSRSTDDPASRGLEKLGLSEVLTVPVRPPENAPVHVVDHLFAAAKIKPLDRQILIKPTETGLREASDILDGHGLKERPWLVVHPGSGGKMKNMPLDNWLHLAREIEKARGLKALFLLGPAEEDLAAVLASSKTLMVQDPSISTLAGLISLSRAYLGHDSGVTHLAAQLGTPTLAVFGPSDPVQWAPRGPRVRILAPPGKPNADWSWLEPDRLKDEALNLLK